MHFCAVAMVSTASAAGRLEAWVWVEVGERREADVVVWRTWSCHVESNVFNYKRCSFQECLGFLVESINHVLSFEEIFFSKRHAPFCFFFFQKCFQTEGVKGFCFQKSELLKTL